MTGGYPFEVFKIFRYVPQQVIVFPYGEIVRDSNNY
jgi:hypothetical protein